MVKESLKKVISMIAGKQAEEIIDYLHGKSYVNEFLIAKNLDMTINQTRNVLYKISDRGFLSSMRKKDKKKGGWYNYFWKIEILKSLEFLKSVLRERIERTEKQINSRETKNFYVCRKCNIEYNEENALLQEFVCMECEQILEIKNNVKSVRALKKSLEELKKELELVNGEIETETEKMVKKRAREEAKEKKAARKTTKKKTAAKKAVKKKTPKKKTNKKTPVRKSK